MLCGAGDKKEEEDPLADTNMALYDSPIATKAREAAAGKEAAWAGVGQEVGVNIWRIEKFQVVAWPPEQYGNFYSGDSYIILNTFKPNPEEADLDYEIFFWLGKDSTQDEYGTAAYKAVELDTFLGGEPVQFREVQGKESEDFEEVFPTVKYLDGGVASGFNKVKPEEYQTRLLMVRQAGRGRKNVKVTAVPLSVDSLCKNEAYVLDAGMHVFAASFGGASVWEKMKANDVVDKLQQERPKCEDHTIDSFDEESDQATMFWKIIGEKPADLPDAYAGDDEKKEDDAIKVYKVHDCGAKGAKTEISELEFELVDGKLPRSLLSDNKSDIVAIVAGGILYVWVGSGASKAEKAAAIPLLSNEREDFAKMPTRKYTEGKERASFLAMFSA